MSQLIACKSRHGIVLAADSKALELDTAGNVTTMEVSRLIQLSQHTAVLAGGAVAGNNMCLALKQFVAREEILDVDEVYNAALPFLATEYERYMRKHCEVLPLDPIHHVHFVLGGYSKRDEQDPYKLFLIWTKKKLPLLDGDEISSAFTVPRVIRLEYRLNRLCKEDTPPDKVLPEVRAGMEGLAAAQPDEIGGPFSYALITREGYRQIG